MTEVDAAALERNSSPSVELAGLLTLRGPGSSDAVGGFDAFDRVYVTLAVGELRRNSRDSAVTLTVEQSDDGDTWAAAAAAVVFAVDGVEFLVLDGPSAFLRVSWSLAGLRSCRLIGASVTPGSLDPPGGPGGSIALDDLTDVDLSGASDDDVLTKDGSEWVARAPSGGSQPLVYEFTVDATTFPMGMEIVGTGIMLEIGDRIIDIGESIPAPLTNGADFLFGANSLSASDKLSGSLFDGNTPNDGGPYSGDRAASVYYGLADTDVIGANGGRLPCTVLTAHELMMTSADAFEGDDACTISVYVIRAASVVTLPTPVAPGP